MTTENKKIMSNLNKLSCRYVQDGGGLDDALKFSKGHPFSNWDRIRYDKTGFNCIDQCECKYSNHIDFLLIKNKQYIFSDGTYAAWWYGPFDYDVTKDDPKVPLPPQLPECGFVNSPFAWNHEGGFNVDR